MLLMSYMSNRSVWRKLRSIRSLLRFMRRESGGVPVDADGERAATAPTTCNDPESVYNLAALRDGLLAPREIPALAEHVARCETCQIVLAIIVKDMTRVEATAKHTVLPDPPGRAGSGPRSRSKPGAPPERGPS